MQFLGIPSSDASGQKKWGDKRDLVMALTSFVAANRWAVCGSCQEKKQAGCQAAGPQPEMKPNY
jgi:hypothetical protein